MGKPTAHNYASARHLSCQGCRTRKSKCSRTFPCVSCAVRGEECIWIDTEPAHGVLQSSLEENIAEIRRLNKVVKQLQGLLIERDLRTGGGGGGNGTIYPGYMMSPTSATTPAAGVVTPPTPPGMDYLPAAVLPPPPPPMQRQQSMPQYSDLSTHGYGPTSFATAGEASALRAPPMLRSQSEYGYTFPPPPPSASASSSSSAFAGGPHYHHHQHEYHASLSAQPRYAPPSMYDHQQQGVGPQEEVLSISPSELSPVHALPNRARATTWPSSMLTPQSANPFPPASASSSATLPNPPSPFHPPIPSTARSFQSEQYSPHHPAVDYSAPPTHAPPSAATAMMLSSSPHSLKFDAAVTLAKGLAATANSSLDDLDEGRIDEEGEGAADEAQHPTDVGHGDDDDDDLYALPDPRRHQQQQRSPRTSAGITSSAPMDLAQLATVALSRRGSMSGLYDSADAEVDYDHHHQHHHLEHDHAHDNRGMDESPFALPLATAEKGGQAANRALAMEPGRFGAADASMDPQEDADTTEWLFRLPGH
ncbi:hypothetical protein JCM10908_005109 [Rhodotorula pacifica]|uniref:Zn(II)2Cys6 transcription factor domain-containing protein n=1 Tax=Rhodotorula pacifica TaxID=1495444 RepID=UPI00317C572A